MRFLVTVSKGLEEVVRGELQGLALQVLEASPGLVAFKGTLADAYAANLHLRSARRVLWPLAEFSVRSPDDLYEGARSVDWRPFLTPEGTFAVEATVRDSCFSHSGFAALKVKDAVADAFRDLAGRRPDVDRTDPSLQVVGHIQGSLCNLAADMSGGPLHKRGYRQRPTVGALNETLAAGIVILSGYLGDGPFCDPMCGSGTILIEAALLGSRTAPGLLRKGPFGFERWPNFNATRWQSVRERALSLVRHPSGPILGCDADSASIISARANAKAAGVGALVKLEARAVRDFLPPQGPGILCTNPPYGDHVEPEGDLGSLYRDLGDMLKRRAAGYRAFVLTGNPALAKHIGLHPDRKVALANGPRQCRLLGFEIFEGGRREHLSRRAGDLRDGGSQ